MVFEYMQMMNRPVRARGARARELARARVPRGSARAVGIRRRSAPRRSRLAGARWLAFLSRVFIHGAHQAPRVGRGVSRTRGGGPSPCVRTMGSRPEHKALFTAIKNNDHDQVRALVAQHPTILRDASKNAGTTKAVGYAVEQIVWNRGACCEHRSPPAEHRSPLPPAPSPCCSHSAARRRSTAALEMIATLCDAGADVNDRGDQTTADTPLLTAATLVSPDMRGLVGLLLQRGADPRLTNIDGRTAAQECTNVRLRVADSRVG